MSNYTKFIYQLKRKVSNFSKSISKNLSKPKTKFITQMIYGLLKGQSVLLSNIARSLKEDILFKKTVERLSRNLENFNQQEELITDYLNKIKPHIDDNTVFCCDKSDIVKPYSKELEALDRVRDGSKCETEKGYDTFEIAALTDNKELPIEVYSHIYSSLESGFKSRNIEALKGLNFIEKHFGKKGIYALDRGYDANLYYKYFTDSNKDFVIRAKSNRNLIYKGRSINIKKIADLYKGKYVYCYTNQDNKERKLKFSYAPIKLPALKDKKLTLVIVRGLGNNPMMLITNLRPKAKKLTLTILKAYIKRWRIEEYFRFKKQKFDFENFRVRSLKRIRNLDLILSIAIGFLALFSNKKKQTELKIIVKKVSDRIFNLPDFDYYAIADGFKAILEKSYTGINSFLKSYYQKQRSQNNLQLSLPL
ncbi:transposase [Iocasia frigidifontis]|uniref:Transposase n=1 Tax=Iocasia fonsfrigidae TaxID=2682810 RepID=A0A8A7KLR8_9FIRM|nr:transposase [Iocasia fonsfrigidae]QTL99777.1 transposase [Iocasia fonsfrigidae]